MKPIGIPLFAVMTAIFPRSPLLAADGASLSATEQLGKFLFFDPSLSVPEGQSCAACHGPEGGFTGPDEELNKGGAVYEGAVKGRFGNRKPPASSYAGDSPILYFDRKERVWVGGMFWDGRATGKRLKDPLAEQAQGPFLNPLEQNIPNIKIVCIKGKNSSSADLFEKVWEKAPWTAGRTSPPPTTGSQKVLLLMNDPRR
jgi:cytochrome c peroxidase